MLERRGATVIARNVRLGHDEIDLVVAVAGVRVAVEVKTRVGADPAGEFTPDQAFRLRRAARALDPPATRCDLIAIIAGDTGVTLDWRRSVA